MAAMFPIKSSGTTSSPWHEAQRKTLDLKQSQKDLARRKENEALARAAGNLFMVLAQHARVRGRLK